MSNPAPNNACTEPRQITPGLTWWEFVHALRAARQFAWLEAGSGNAALCHLPTITPEGHTLYRMLRKRQPLGG